MKLIFEILPYILSITGIVLGIISLRQCNKEIKKAEDRLKILEK